MLEITDKFKAFLKWYGVKSMKEYYGLTQKEKSNLAKEYLRVINKRVYPMWENGVGKILQSIVDEMPTYWDPDNDYDRERDNSIWYDF